jgi:hypothetical protein
MSDLRTTRFEDASLYRASRIEGALALAHDLDSIDRAAVVARLRAIADAIEGVDA